METKASQFLLDETAQGMREHKSVARQDAEYALRQEAVKLAEMMIATADAIMDCDAERDIAGLLTIAGTSRHPYVRSEIDKLLSQITEMKLKTNEVTR